MIISRTPLRISLLGGGTDYPEWYMEHDGAVISTTINHHAWVWYVDGRIHSDVSLPERSGLATSSAKTVGILKILAEMQTKTICDPKVISDFSTLIEREKLAGNVGYQDQYICSKGGFRLIRFSELGIKDMELDAGWLEPYMMLFHTRQRRSRAGDIVSSQINEMADHTELYFRLMSLVEEGLNAINAKDWEWFGNILHDSWIVKRELSNKITSEAIDDIYNTGLKAGAIGGKLLGAGGGGAILFVVIPDKQKDVIQALDACWYIPFKFEKEGTKIIFRDE